MKYYLLILICVIVIFFCLKKTYKEGTYKEGNITIIVSRYNENLEWLNHEPFNNYQYIVCNKGNNDSYLKTHNFKKEIKLENVGREGHTYLYYIITHYNHLSNINIFLPGSVNLENKYNKAKKLINEINKYNSSVFLYDDYHFNIKNELYHFKIDEYVSTEIANRTEGSEKIQISPIRPYGKWYEAFFGENITNHFIKNGVFSVSKEDIIKKPKSYYEQLIKEVETPNPEQGHYLERSWEAVFFPMNTIFINAHI
jgi:hypothetical protein